MNYRNGSEKDLPAIIDLLKASLGESHTSKSEQLWKWKHHQNPFGKSPILIAEEGGKIIGLRTFLRWEFTYKNNIINAARAVDTAVHPAHQGKGIFRKLTLELVDQMKRQGVDLIYNTPNSNSLPGYLSMGWNKYGKLPVKLKFKLTPTQKADRIHVADWNDVSGLLSKIEAGQTSPNHVQTNLVEGYLSWRYASCPLFPYSFISDGATYLLVYRIVQGKMGRELRVTDLFTLDAFGKMESKQLNAQLNIIQNKGAVRFISYSGLKYPHQKAIHMGALPTMVIGPVVTLRQMKDSMDPKDLPWNWSLGDLEVF